MNEAVQDLMGRLRDLPEVVTDLVKIGAPAVESLCGALKDPPNRVRQLAAEALVQIGAPAVEPLCRALKDEDNRVRSLAAEALRRIGDGRAAAALCLALKDKDECVRRSAAGALVKVGDARAVEALCLALQDAEALVHIGAPAIEPLCRVLKDKHAGARPLAAEALGRIGDRSSLPRKVLADVRLTITQRILALEAMHQVRLCGPVLSLLHDLADDQEEGVRHATRAVLEAMTLVRASTPGEDDEQVLLRPVRGRLDPAPETLLRTAAPPEESPPPDRHW